MFLSDTHTLSIGFILHDFIQCYVCYFVRELQFANVQKQILSKYVSEICTLLKFYAAKIPKQRISFISRRNPEISKYISTKFHLFGIYYCIHHFTFFKEYWNLGGILQLRYCKSGFSIIIGLHSTSYNLHIRTRQQIHLLPYLKYSNYLSYVLMQK